MKRLYNREMQHCLNELDSILNKGLQPWWNRIAMHVGSLKDDIHFSTLPLVCVAAYTVQGVERSRALAMANLFRTVYLANHIHQQVRDEAEGQECDQRLQSDILLGDYIFGHLMQLLLDAQAEEMLDDLAQLMVTINEGYIWERAGSETRENVVLKTRVSYYEVAFRTAARMGSDREVESFAEIGAAFGKALTLFSDEGLAASVYSRLVWELMRELGQRRREVVVRLGQLRSGMYPESLLYAAVNG